MPEISIKAEQLFEVWGLSVTNSMLLAFISVLVLLFVAWLVHHRIQLIPGKLQSIIELVIEQIMQLMDSVFGNRRMRLNGKTHRLQAKDSNGRMILRKFQEMIFHNA